MDRISAKPMDSVGEGLTEAARKSELKQLERRRGELVEKLKFSTTIFNRAARDRAQIQEELTYVEEKIETVRQGQLSLGGEA